MITKNLKLSKILTTTVAFTLASCGFERQTDEDLNQGQAINYRDYADIIGTKFSLTDDTGNGFGLTSSDGFNLTALSCTSINLAVVGSKTGFADTYTGDTASVSLDIVKGDPVGIKVNSITCGGTAYTYVSDGTDTFGNGDIITLANGGNNLVLVYGAGSACIQGGCQDTVQLSLAVKAFEKEQTDLTAAFATYGVTTNYSFNGVQPPAYSLKAIKYASTDQTSGAISFKMGWECTVAGSPAVTNDASKTTAACSGIVHKNTFAVWLDWDDAWSTLPTDAQVNTAITAAASRVVDADNPHVLPANAVIHDNGTPGDATDDVKIAQDGLIFNTVATAGSFYTKLNKLACLYHVESGNKGIKCRKVTFQGP